MEYCLYNICSKYFKWTVHILCL